MGGNKMTKTNVNHKPETRKQTAKRLKDAWIKKHKAPL